MDYPQLNLIFGLVLILTTVISIVLRILLSKTHLPAWASGLSWISLALNLSAALYIEILFLRLMIPAFNRQIALGWIVTGGIGALVTAYWYRKELSPRTVTVMLVAQIIISLVGLLLAFGLYRSLVPV